MSASSRLAATHVGIQKITSKNKYLIRLPVIGFAVSRIFKPNVIVSTVSVLAACLLFVSVFALTNREKINDNQSNFDGFLQL